MNEPEQDNQELEISDLPGTPDKGRVSAFLRVLAARPRLRSRLWQAGIAAIVLCLLFIWLPGYLPLLNHNLSGIFAGAPPQPTPVATSQSSLLVVGQDVQSQFNGKKVLIWDASTPPVVMPFATLDAAPGACPQNTLTQTFDSALPAGAGGAPMWVTGFSGPRATLNHLIRAQPPELGWHQQIQLVGATNYAGAIKLQGGIAGSMFPLWFGFDPHEKELIVNYQFNPLDSSISNHTTDDQQWIVRPINLYIPQAGCYYLQATWDGGSWTVYFAAGR